MPREIRQTGLTPYAADAILCRSEKRYGVQLEFLLALEGRGIVCAPPFAYWR